MATLQRLAGGPDNLVAIFEAQAQLVQLSRSRKVVHRQHQGVDQTSAVDQYLL